MLNRRRHSADTGVMGRQAHHWSSEQGRFGLDSALLLAYAVCFAIVAVLLPIGGSVDWPEVGPALALQLGVGLLLAASARLRVAGPRFAGLFGVIAYLASVALL